jgi:DNA-binding CsgD family transcriptional regulator
MGSGRIAPVSAAPTDDTAPRALLASLAQLEREIVELRYTQRLDATERVREALRRLADAGPPPSAILERAAAELGGCTPFDRVLVSRLRGSVLQPAAIWSGDQVSSGAGERPASDGLFATAVALAPGWIEAEVARSGRTVIVDAVRGDVQAAPALVAALGRRSFVLGAVALRGQPVALVHAGVDPGMRALGELDRELVELFAVGLGGVLERAALEHALSRHRSELAAASRFLGRRLGATTDPAPPVLAHSPVPAQDGTSDDPLTARELEVLSLLAQGATNRGVAQALQISEGTVKYHVKNILRKLRARSRADAVARHLRRPQGSRR